MYRIVHDQVTSFTEPATSMSGSVSLSRSPSQEPEAVASLAVATHPTITCGSDQQRIPEPSASRFLFALMKSDLRAKAEWCYQSTQWRAILKTLLTDGTTA